MVLSNLLQLNLLRPWWIGLKLQRSFQTPIMLQSCDSSVRVTGALTENKQKLLWHLVYQSGCMECPMPWKALNYWYLNNSNSLDGVPFCEDKQEDRQGLTEHRVTICSQQNNSSFPLRINQQSKSSQSVIKLMAYAGKKNNNKQPTGTIKHSRCTHDFSKCENHCPIIQCLAF